MVQVACTLLKGMILFSAGNFLHIATLLLDYKCTRFGNNVV